MKCGNCSIVRWQMNANVKCNRSSGINTNELSIYTKIYKYENT